MQLVNVGCSPGSLCNDPRQTFKGIPDLHITNLDVDKNTGANLVHDIRLPIPEAWKFKYDVVYASHVLEHIERAKVHAAVQNFKDLLYSGGEMWIFVPSLEWACKKILKGKDTGAVQGVLYGGQKDQWDLHLTGYTLNSLEFLVKSHGLTIKKAGYSAFASTFNGKRELVLQNVVVGVKGA